jgi:hypothetical protein
MKATSRGDSLSTAEAKPPSNRLSDYTFFTYVFPQCAIAIFNMHLGLAHDEVDERLDFDNIYRILAIGSRFLPLDK